jgi:lipopolysaccharide export system permease protein
VTILHRHVLGEFAKIFGLCLAALLGIYYIVDIFNHMDIFITYKAPLGWKFSYFLYKLPLVIYQVAPVAVLISVVMVLGVMARYSELTAVKAGGVSIFYLTIPLVTAAFCVSGLIFVNNEYLLPYTNQQATQILDVRIKGKPPRGIFRQSRIWYVGRDNTLWNIDILDPAKGTLEGVTLFRLDENYCPQERIDAQRATRQADGWLFEGVVRRIFADNCTRLKKVMTEKRLVLQLPESLNDFVKYKKDPDEMNYQELRRYVRKLRSSGFNATPYQVDMLAKTAIPCISFVVAFLSIGLAVRRGSARGGVVAAIGLCMAVGLLYWLTLSIGLSLGHAGRLPPLLAAWGANIIFGATGLFFYANLKQ